MKWWHRSRRVYVDPNHGQAAVKAMHEAEARWPEVRHLAATLRRESKANHFRQRFQAEFERMRES